MSILRSFANPILPFLENDSLSTVADTAVPHFVSNKEA